MNEIKQFIPAEVLAAYDLGSELVGARPFGKGHINDTFAVYYQMEDGSSKRFIIQRINTSVFQDSEGLMQNIVGVTSFLKQAIIKNGGDPLRETLNVIQTKDGKTYVTDHEKKCWRVYLFIENATTFQQVKDAQDFYNSAVALGKFQQLLADYPAGTLNETIPDFHHTPLRYYAFEQAVKQDRFGLAKEVSTEIEFIKNRKSETNILVDLLAGGELPLRVTHNDTKLNNIMIDNSTGKGICIIDLDTVMPGLSLYDFGDSIRFGASTAQEDEPDLDKVQMDLNLFEAFTKGYLEAAGSILTPKEKEMLPMGAKMMTLECGMRFLTDYLSGDTYFKISRKGQNLDRARTQLKLVQDMENKWEQMKAIVLKYSK